MNWLAHLFLSQPNGADRLGNLFGDLVKLKERKTLNSCFNKGLKCHLSIDYFTDNHIVFRHSKKRLDRGSRRYSGVLIDVFYDHFLATNWHCYSQVGLANFTQEVYQSFEEYWELIPPFPQIVIYRMIEQDWLASYYYVDGIEATLKRIKAKLSNKHQEYFVVSHFLAQLENNYEALEEDFRAFFPEIISHINLWQKLN